MKALSDLIANYVWMMRPSPLGDVWTYRDPMTNIKSCAEDNVEQLNLCFRNRCHYPLILCWVNDQGKPHHFYRLEPSAETGQITSNDRTEQTHLGHAFLLAYCPEGEIEQRKKQKTLEGTTLVGGYRPRNLTPFGGKDDQHTVHIVEILPGRERLVCCGGSNSNLRGAKVKNDQEDEETTPSTWRLKISMGEIDPTPIDSTCKKYTATTLGGWPVFLDPEWEKAPLKYRKQLENDLKQLCKILPKHAVDYLQANTPIWVNCSLQYGPKAKPINGSACCFHPDAAWLIEQGCHPQKVQSVEIYDLVSEYEGSNIKNWGAGGVMVHEFSHAYHFKCLPGGYDNPEVFECWKAAMKEGLYDEVEVHGENGKRKCKAYACNNQMEYFAELSTAFLGGLDDNIEYNKWYPFNRKQVKEHDPRMYELLKKVWKVEDIDK